MTEKDFEDLLEKFARLSHESQEKVFREMEKLVEELLRSDEASRDTTPINTDDRFSRF